MGEKSPFMSEGYGKSDYTPDLPLLLEEYWKETISNTNQNLNKSEI